MLTLRKLALTLLCAGIALTNYGCGPKEDATPTPPAPAPPTTAPPANQTTPASATPAAPADAAKPGKTVKLPDGLEYTDVTVGTGPTPLDGQKVVVNYTGTLIDGTKFDSSLDRNEPFEFTLAGNGVIKGWDEGVRGMKVGGKRKLKIPPELGYGKQGSPPKIPANATLLFEIDLLDVK